MFPGKSMGFVTKLFRSGCLIAIAHVLTACASTGEYEIDETKIASVGFQSPEVTALGEMVEIAYELFRINPANRNPAFPVLSTDQIRPLANLRARDELPLGAKEFYGHVSWRGLNNDSLLISIRGTEDYQEWVDDAKFLHVDYPFDTATGRVEWGFTAIFTSFEVSFPGNDVQIPLFEYLATLAEPETITVVGHSLGSALATLVAYESARLRLSQKVRLVTFASPRVGDGNFAQSFENLVANSLRIVNRPDFIPRLPPRSFGFTHVWHELEVSSKGNRQVAKGPRCYHSLQTYLYLFQREFPAKHRCNVE